MKRKTYRGVRKNRIETLVLYSENGKSKVIKPFNAKFLDWGAFNSASLELAHSLIKIEAGEELANKHYWRYCKDFVMHLPEEFLIDSDHVNTYISSIIMYQGVSFNAMPFTDNLVFLQGAAYENANTTTPRPHS